MSVARSLAALSNQAALRAGSPAASTEPVSPIISGLPWELPHT